MFRKYFLLILLPLFAACDNKDSNVPEIQTPVAYYKVPHMIADTLISTTQKDNTFVYDTLYTDADDLNTYIYYKNNVYTLKAIVEKGERLADSAGVFMCDLFDGNNAKLNTQPITATTSLKYNVVYKELETMRQTIDVNFPPFPEDAGLYKGIE